MVEPVRIRGDFERAVIGAIEAGLPLVARPYADIAERLGVDEERVIETLAVLQREGAIRRMGVIVRHHELGYRANGMVVWDVPDDEVGRIGRLFGDAPFVTLSYRRPRRPPQWRYNLFTMIHGRTRAHVVEMVERLAGMVPDRSFPHEILFSGRRFKQRGARYAGGAVVSPPQRTGDRALTRRETK